ncbi:hypothetical protein PYCCODRAFT_483919 [Trametes coccinea BRFM310]|uniref:Uncharacterized protein n=1 Tax=Trametes coccinea (strain BRFM310) TaxID=1353009 RepID=A0A1Y2INJ7_TRAC3|nr:hypothetical protein PYCCODRAFT_483919 [Trametes coccinea BRFM310]
MSLSLITSSQSVESSPFLACPSFHKPSHRPCSDLLLATPTRELAGGLGVRTVTLAAWRASPKGASEPRRPGLARPSRTCTAMHLHHSCARPADRRGDALCKLVCPARTPPTSAYSDLPALLPRLNAMLYWYVCIINISLLQFCCYGNAMHARGDFVPRKRESICGSQQIW